MTAIGVIGGGAWGTALAQVAARGGEPVLLWAREAEVVEAINAGHENPLFLPGVPLSPAIRATGDLGRSGRLRRACWSSPRRSMSARVLGAAAGRRSAAGALRQGDRGGHAACWSARSRAEVQPDAPIAVLSGPTFAHEVAAGLPTAVTLACADEALGATLADRARRARPSAPMRSDDVIGAEIGGAVKNVLAIACGVVEGAGLGQNARAALIARGFAEMTRFGLARGARAETLAGLSGLGDLVLTCSSTSSRNFSLGVGLGQGAAPRELLADRRTVAEGAFTAPVLREAARGGGRRHAGRRGGLRAARRRATVGAVIERAARPPARDEHM